MVDPPAIIGGSSNDPNNTQSNNLWEDPGWVNVEEEYESYVSSRQSKIKKLVDNLTFHEVEVKGRVQWLKSHGKQCKRGIEIDSWLQEALNLIKKALQVIELLGQTTNAVSEEYLTDLTKELEGHIEEKPLVMWNELVGHGFERDLKEVLRLLRDSQVFVIGISGMGGVGKTCLATHVKDEIMRNNVTYNCKHVIWVNVSQKFNVLKLQNDIARRIGITFDEDDEVIRAEILSCALNKIENWVLILDDVWSYIDLHKVGIPLRQKGTKLIFISRLKHVHLQMDCSPHNIVSVKPLSTEDGWELFLLKLGYHGAPATLASEVKMIARSVCDECDGLPLGINVIARTMKGVHDISQWRHYLRKLQSLETEVGVEMEEEVLNVLKISYDNLKYMKMQKCFLNCAIHLGSYHVKNKQFIKKLVEAGLINGSWEEKWDEGDVILDTLKSKSLLLEDENGYLRMHGLVRVMACRILRHENTMPNTHIRECRADLEGEVVGSKDNMMTNSQNLIGFGQATSLLDLNLLTPSQICEIQTQAQQQQNQNAIATKPIKRGVKQRDRGKWVADIRLPENRTRLRLGTFDTAEEAALPYDRAAYKVQGSFAKLNFPSLYCNDQASSSSKGDSSSSEGFESYPSFSFPKYPTIEIDWDSL